MEKQRENIEKTNFREEKKNWEIYRKGEEEQKENKEKTNFREEKTDYENVWKLRGKSIQR